MIIIIIIIRIIIINNNDNNNDDSLIIFVICYVHHTLPSSDYFVLFLRYDGGCDLTFSSYFYVFDIRIKMEKK